MNKKLYFDREANSFVEAFPLGNGHIGAMVYGGIKESKISLNSDTLWSGTGRRRDKKISGIHLERAKDLVSHGRYFEASEYIKNNMLGNYNESYMPFGDIIYSFIDVETHTNYSRILDIENAIYENIFEANRSLYKTEMFISKPDNIFVVNISIDGVHKINLDISISSKIRHKVEEESDKGIYLSGNAPSLVVPNYIEVDEAIIYDDNNKGMAFAALLKVEKTDGKLSVENNTIKIREAKNVLIYISLADGYESYTADIEKDVNEIKKLCLATNQRLSNKSYEEVKSLHIEDYKKAYKNVYLSLGKNKDKDLSRLSLDDRLTLYKNGEDDLDLEALFFHYNRYLLVASSRKGTQVANLQGIWNESIRPVWSSNFTININTQMNYWHALSSNLLDSFEAFIDFVESISIAGEETAKNFFDCKGFVANHNVDIWRHTEPVGGDPRYAYWPMGGIWLTNQTYEYYKYTLDIDCLRNKIYPILEKAVQFIDSWLIKKEDGLYYTPLSSSPENTFFDELGRECSISYMSTMDLALIKDLFSNYLQSVQILGLKTDMFFNIQEKINKLPAYKLDESEKIKEWIDDFEPVDKGHRHFSPIYGLFPGNSIKKSDKLLFSACKKFVENKAIHSEKEIGWSCAWLINIWAKLGNADKAYKYYNNLLRNLVYSNLFDLHPPLEEGYGEREVFQIDGNFGSASGLVNMIVQSDGKTISLLPALPKKWSCGRISNILLYGNVEIDIEWENMKPIRLRLFSLYSCDLEIEYNNKILAKICLEKLKNKVLDLSDI